MPVSLNTSDDRHSKNPHKRTRDFRFRLILFLYIRTIESVSANQPEDILKAPFLEIILLRRLLSLTDEIDVQSRYIVK